MKLQPLTTSLLILCLLSSCAPAAVEESSTTFLAMDTVMSVTVYGPGGDAALEAAEGEIKALEGLLSVTDEGSEIYAANHSGGEPVTLSPETAELLSTVLELCGQTVGALDVTIYPVVRAWGFTTGEYRVPDKAELAQLLERVDYTQVELNGNSLTVPEGMELDLGAVGKGCAADQTEALLRELGVDCAKLELGGNIHFIGTKPNGKPWRVEVQNPFGEGRVGVLETDSGAVVTSGGYERYFTQDDMTYWHIIDPKTGRPAQSGLVSVTIAAKSGTLADALSTALFVMGRDRALDYWRSNSGFEVILVEQDKNVWITPGLADQFKLAEGLGYTLNILEE